MPKKNFKINLHRIYRRIEQTGRPCGNSGGGEGEAGEAARSRFPPNCLNEKLVVIYGINNSPVTNDKSIAWMVLLGIFSY